VGDFLRYLTERQSKALLSVADSLEYTKGEIILAEGERRCAIFLIREGAVRVERAHMGFNVEISLLQSGEIFGEMSFVEEFGASASVVAQSDVKVDVIAEEHVEAVGREDQSFFGGFYRSVAEVLSRRLRETTVRSISEYSWGGFGEFNDSRTERSDSWGGGSPLRESLTEGK